METKRQEDIRKLMQMPEEAIASLNESEADRLGRLAVMFYKETGDGVYKEKAEQIRAAQGELPEDICAMPFFMEYETVCGKKERYNKIVDRMEENAQDGLDYSGKCYISQSACIEDAKEVAKLVEERFPKLHGKVKINYIGTTIGSHTGPGTVALFFWGKKRED